MNSDNTFQPIKVLNQPSKKIRIGKAEKEILKGITIDFLTFDEIVNRRKCSKEAVYKVLRRLKEKGLISGAFGSVESVESTKPSDNTLFRLHAQEWNIKLISKTNKYFQIKNKSNTFPIDGNTIRLFNDSIEIYSGQSFFEKTEQRATAVSLAYWNRFFARLEHELGISIVKPRVPNIDLVNQHYGETNSEMAKDSLKRNEKIKIQTEDDGKVWFTIDNSWNLKERECLHPETAKQDSEKVTKQLNDWRKFNPPTNSELASHIGNFINGFDNYGKHIISHVSVLNNIDQGQKQLNRSIKQLTRVMKGILVENQNLKLNQSGQKRLGEFL